MIYGLDVTLGRLARALRRVSRSARLRRACALFTFVALPSFAQERALQRDFQAGTRSRYRIQLKVRSEVEGQQPVQIGAKTYVKPFSRFAEKQVSWRATRQVVSVGPDGAAEIEETLDEFGGEGSSRAPDEESEKLLRAMSQDLGRWPDVKPFTLRYRETRSGQLLNLGLGGYPRLDEAPPRLVSLWLLRALRPTGPLPSQFVRFGERWQEPRAVQLENWAEARGSETGEWLAVTGSPEPVARLHIAQEIFGTVVNGPDMAPEGAAQGRFHGESVNTLSLGDARLLTATRSATREITWTLAPVEGLRERPQFRGRLSVEVQIEACDEKPCLSPDVRRPALGKQQ